MAWRSKALLVVLAFACAPTQQAVAQSWTSVGPPGGSTFSLAFDPQNPATVYAGTRGGVFKSTDGGSTWSPMNNGLPGPGIEFGGPWIPMVVADPRGNNRLYAGVFSRGFFFEPSGVGVFVSEDGGNSWQPANTGIQNRVLWALAIDPQTPTTLYAAGSVSTGFETVLFKSTDAGATWAALSSLSTFPRALAIDPQSPAIVYAGTNTGVSKSTDGGGSWMDMNAGASVINVSAFALDPTDSTTVYAATRFDGIFKSTAGGPWASVNTGLASLEILGLAVHPQTPSTLYAATVTGGVFKSTNGGTTWSPVNNGLPSPSVLSVAINPRAPARVYAGVENFGLFSSDDGGSEWTLNELRNLRALSLASTADGTRFVADDWGHIYNNGDEGRWQLADTLGGYTPMTALVVDPQNPLNIFGGASPDGVFKSTDGGTSFTNVFRTQVLTMAIDPIVPSTVYAGGGFAFKSVDGGVTWTESGSGLGGGRLTSFAVDPQQSTTLYAAKDNIFKSEDGGANWVLSSAGVPEREARSLAIDPHTPSTIYAGTFGSGVFKSVNAGADWTAANAGLPPVPVFALLVDPETPSTVYAGTDNGVFKTENGGTSWTAFNDGLPNLFIRSLSFDAQSRTLIAGTDGAGSYAIGTQPTTFTLSLRTIGRGPVTTALDPGDITCELACDEVFPAGTTITLTATPKQGLVMGWVGCDSDTGGGRSSSCTVTMNANREVKVQLNRKPSPKEAKHHGRRDDDDDHHRAHLVSAMRNWLIDWRNSSLFF